MQITDLDKCDFKPMYAYFEEEREKTKSLNAAAKKECVLRRLRLAPSSPAAR